jgi:probable HAF family extracellular repeat protein
MKSSTLMCITTVIVFAVLAMPVRLAAQDQQEHHKKQTHYAVKDLGTLGGTFSLAGGLNDKGQVEGYATLPHDTATHAFLWRNGVMTDLGTLGGPNSTAAFRPSEKREVGGYAETSSPDPNGEDFCGFGTHLICLAFVWHKGVMTPLPTLGGNNGAAHGFNNRGQVVGFAENTTKDPTCVAPQVLQFKPVVSEKDWDKDDVQELPTFPGDPDGDALAINDKGQAAGTSGNCARPNFHALLWQRDEVESQNEDARDRWTVADLGNLGGTKNNVPLDINNESQVVGFSDLRGDTTNHAFLWTKEDGMQDLGTLPGDAFSVADGINDEGQVVGGSSDIHGNGRAFLWQNGVMTDLNTLIPVGSPLFLFEATGTINSRGQIAGFAVQKSTGQVHAFLATPCDEEQADNEGCENGAEGTTAVRGAISQRLRVVLPENVRKLLQQRLRFGRFGDGLMKPQ